MILEMLLTMSSALTAPKTQFQSWFLDRYLLMTRKCLHQTCESTQLIICKLWRAKSSYGSEQTLCIPTGWYTPAQISKRTQEWMGVKQEYMASTKPYLNPPDCIVWATVEDDTCKKPHTSVLALRKSVVRYWTKTDRRLYHGDLSHFQSLFGCSRASLRWKHWKIDPLVYNLSIYVCFVIKYK